MLSNAINVILLLFYSSIFILIAYTAFKGFIKIKCFKKPILNCFLLWSLSLVSFLILVFFFKSFIIEPFKVPSSSMEDTIKEGDVIIVDKVLLKITLINRGDVIVFKNFINNYFVKRCIGKAGDLVRIVNGEIFIENKLVKEPLSVKMKYQIKVKNNVWFYKILDSLNIKSNIFPSTKNTFEGILKNKDKIKLMNTSKIVSINRIPSLLSKEKLFFNSNKHSRSKDSKGDIKIPKKGMKLLLDKNTHDYYIKTINQYEGVTAINKDNQYVINGFKVENYTFKNDYVFVLGDNRDNSLDSRFKGFVPHYLIIGTVNFVF